jgi:hypothetical protein
MVPNAEAGPTAVGAKTADVRAAGEAASRRELFFM